ncbi:Multidrug export protein MepA [subsurface metagenome]
MHNERHQMLANERIGKLLWKLALPAGIGMFVMALYNVVDTIFIGHVVGTLGIAGLTIVFPIQILVMGMGMLIGIGGASLISRSLGAHDFQRAERTLGNAILLAVILGVLIAIIGLSNSSFWLRLIGASETILPYAKDYLDIILLGTVFRIFAMGVNQLVRAEGNARVAMISMLIGAILNILLDAVFILALRMGIKGAAIATVLSQVLTSLYIIRYYLSQNSSVKLHMKNFVPQCSVIRGIMAIGFGSFVRTAGGSLVAVIVNRTLVGYGGDLAVAAYGIVHRTMMFIFMPIISVGQGLQPILGFSYGARRSDRALQVIKLSAIVATILSIISFLIIFFFPAPIMRIFTNDGSLVSAGSHAAKLIFLAAYLIGFQMVGSVVFQALGKAVPTFVTATSRQILFLLPLVFILPRFLQLDGVWLSFPIADALSFILTLALFIPQIRALRSMDLPAKT